MRTPEVKYIYGGGKRIAMEKDGGIYYYHPDRLGSVRLITDEDGTVLKKYNYTAFGSVLSDSGSFDNDYRYTSQAIDENDLYYMHARFYDNSIGRFTSCDPANSGHSYNYTPSNPTNFTDPMGLMYDYTRSPMTYYDTSPVAEWHMGIYGCAGVGSFVDASGQEDDLVQDLEVAQIRLAIISRSEEFAAGAAAGFNYGGKMMEGEALTALQTRDVAWALFQLVAAGFAKVMSWLSDVNIVNITNNKLWGITSDDQKIVGINFGKIRNGVHLWNNFRDFRSGGEGFQTGYEGGLVYTLAHESWHVHYGLHETRAFSNARIAELGGAYVGAPSTSWGHAHAFGLRAYRATQAWFDYDDTW